MYILNNLLTPFKIQPTQAHLLDWSQLAHESVGKFLTIAFTSLIYLAIWTIGKKFINKYLIQNPHFQQRVSSRKNFFTTTCEYFPIYAIIFLHLWHPQYPWPTCRYFDCQCWCSFPSLRYGSSGLCQ